VESSVDLVRNMAKLTKTNMWNPQIIMGSLFLEIFLAHLSTKCSVSFCDPSMSGVRRPSVRPCVRQQFL